MQVKINLNNPPTSDKINVDLQWRVQVGAPKPGVLARLFRRHNRVTRDLKLSVSDIIVPQEIICDKDKLFSILCGEKEYSQSEFPVSVRVTDMAMPFQLIFHQGEIKDCTRQQDDNPRSYIISFSVNLLDLDGNVVDEVKEEIEIIFDPLGVKPRFAIDVNDEIQYSASLGKEQVGIFAAWLDEDFQFVPDQFVAVSLKLCKGTTELPGLITLGNGSNISDLVIKAGRRNCVKLPIFIDFTTIPNPIALEDDFTIEALIVLSPSYSPEVKETILEQAHFKLLKDQQGTELRVSVQMPDEEPKLLDGDRSFPVVPLSFTPQSIMMGRVDVILQNIASANNNRNSGLYIKNLTLTEELLGGVRVLGHTNTSLERFITIDGADVDSMNSEDGLFIANGADASSTIHVSFNPSGIVDVLNSNNYHFKLQSTLTFDYWEDADGLGNVSEDSWKKKSIPIMWLLHLEPNPEWLCVDYGSSAIVCRYNKDIINLKSRKDQIYRTSESFRQDDFEKNTPFLSSDIVFHNVNVSETNRSTLCSQQNKDDKTPYLDLTVCLSPTSSLIKSEVRTQLPCLKILVGNEFLPDKPDFLSFQYARKDNNGTVDKVAADKVRDEESCILRISSIFNEAYSSLFRYFILPESKGKSINKLVLTYPNTYTPAHLKVLERIARETFPKIRDGYLKFVSESDAVSAYYIDNWNTFNKSNGSITDDETVLVYDMGAGTLDVTLFSKRLNEDGKIEVNILGKIGTGKAGNYLDYVISEIINDKVKNAISNPRTVTTTSVPDVQTLKERLDIKQTVKDSIKPNLKPGNELTCGKEKFDSSIILDDKRFKDFLNQVTEGIIKQLLDYIGDAELNIDTVLMSGRSCRLEALQKGLKAALVGVGCQNARILKFNAKGNKEKTVVVEGAMARAALFSSPDSHVLIRSRRLYASYGLIYKRLGGTYKYVELLKSADLPYISDSTNLNDYEGQNVTVVGTASAGTLKLIQTYLSSEKTETAYNNGDFEFISEMEEYDMADFEGRDSLNVRLKLDYKNNISLYVNGRISIGSSPKGVDLSSEITKRSIWPVTI